MVKNKIKFNHLQEILFWQKLNKQLIALKARRNDIKEKHHKYLQNFSFTKRLFSRITKASFLDEIPLTLITDFSDVCFITLKMQSWNSCLMKLLPKTLSLNIERALADTFVASKKYDKNFPLPKSIAKENEDDQELYGFIEKYLGVREEQGRNITDIITRLHQLKTESIRQVIQIPDYKKLLSVRESFLFLDLTNHDRRREIKTAYFKNFCNQADSIVSSVIQTPFTVYLEGLLINKRDENNLKPSIREFVNHEIAIVEKEYQLMADFRSRVNNRKYQLDLYEIPICSLSPFFFLGNPFPAV
jgi:hypothetical protein